MSKNQVKSKVVAGGITAAQGFRAHAVQCGIKDPKKLRLDLTLICSDRPTVAAGTFTTNKMKAAPVLLSEKRVRNVDVRAILANSGNANACTGVDGLQDAKAMTETAAAELKLRASQVLVCSTGIIGLRMPMDRLLPHIPSLVAGLVDGPDANDQASRAIMTSDTKPKSIAVEIPMGGKVVKIGGIAKGAGMINPNMATMLCFITTDVAISRADLQKATKAAVEQSFNRITIDGDMSTNDTVLVLANGASGVKPITPSSSHWKAFCRGLNRVMLELAKMIVRDGERVTRFVQIDVRGARSATDARKVAEAVANSLLVKCSFHGGDPNWGRVLHAVGYSGAHVVESQTDVYFGGLVAARSGLVAPTPIEKLREVAAQKEFTLTIELNLGKQEYTVYTSDISKEYVDFNTDEYAVPGSVPKKS
jgi:glutamate N-acetyltransferase / amino-acid N-acetyltransferase